MAAIRRRGGTAIGVDLSDPLLERAAEHGRVHRAEVPPLDFLADESVDGVAIVLVLEHLGDERGILSEAARVTRPGGSLVVVANHPIWTAPGSTPIVDGDGEVVWRTGEYFSRGWSDEPAGEGSVRFHHRTMADLLNAAADAGWALRRLEEMGVTAEQIQRTPGLAGQEHIPRLLGAAWSRGRP